MKKMFKKSCALLTTVALTLSCITFVPFAVSADGSDSTASAERDINISHIEFVSGKTDSNADTVKARAFVRDYSGNTGKVSLLCATYDADNNLVGAGVKTGMNALLSTDAYATAGGETTKAYVWDATTLAPVTDTATRGAEIIPTITFDGKSFKEYTGQDFDKDKYEYTGIELKSNQYTKIVKVPLVKAELNDISGSYEIINDREKLQTTVRVYNGDRTVNEKEITGSKTDSGDYTSTKMNVETYKKPYKDYVIKYTLPEGVEMGSSLTAMSNAGSGFIKSASDSFLTKRYTESFEPETGSTTRKVEFTVKNWGNQLTLIAVKPKNETENKNVIVGDENGTALSWKVYDYSSTRLGYDENGTAMYSNISATKPVGVSYTKSDGTTGTDSLIVGEKLYAGSDANDLGNGSMTVDDRAAYANARSYASVSDDLKGCNYILCKSTWGDKAEVKFSFYVNTSVDVVVIGVNDDMLSTDDGWTKTTAAANGENLAKESQHIGSWTPCYAMVHYMNEMPVWHVAYLIHEMGCNRNEFTQRAQLKSGTPTSSGQGVYTIDGTMNYIETYDLNSWNKIYELYEELNQKAYVPSSWENGFGKYRTLNDVLDHWYEIDYSVPGWSDKLYTDVAQDYTGTDDQSVSTWLKGTFATTLTPENTVSFYQDRPISATSNAGTNTGRVKKYPDALELESSTMFASRLNWINSDSQSAADWKKENTNSYQPSSDFDGKWYHFVADRNIEVAVISTNEVDKYKNDANWLSIEKMNDDDHLEVVNSMNAQTATQKDYSWMYSRKYRKGETVQIYAPQNGYITYNVFIKALNDEEPESYAQAQISDVVVTKPVYETGEDGTIVDYADATTDESGNIITEVATANTNNLNARLTYRLKVNTASDHINYTYVTGGSQDVLGSPVVYDRYNNGGCYNIVEAKEATETEAAVAENYYTNDIRTISEKYKDLLGCEYIMFAGQGTERARSGYETSFKLHRSATIIIFAGNTANQNYAKANGWTFESNDDGYVTYKLNGDRNAISKFKNVMTKHFEVENESEGLSVKIDKELLDTVISNKYKDGGDGSYIAVIYYD